CLHQARRRSSEAAWHGTSSSGSGISNTLLLNRAQASIYNRRRRFFGRQQRRRSQPARRPRRHCPARIWQRDSALWNGFRRLLSLGDSDRPANQLETNLATATAWMADLVKLLTWACPSQVQSHAASAAELRAPSAAACPLGVSDGSAEEQLSPSGLICTWWHSVPVSLLLLKSHSAAALPRQCRSEERLLQGNREEVSRMCSTTTDSGRERLRRSPRRLEATTGRSTDMPRDAASDGADIDVGAADLQALEVGHRRRGFAKALGRGGIRELKEAAERVLQRRWPDAPMRRRPRLHKAERDQAELSNDVAESSVDDATDMERQLAKQIAKHREQKMPDDDKWERILQVLDEDKDGKIEVQHVVKVIELLGSENLRLSSRDLTKLLETLDKEKLLSLKGKDKDPRSEALGLDGSVLL
uniref:EF-hand domain-containing protein n=1 Tax=Macrostomum lignano TaxID=282301 RepID=A0A1I8HEY8_9PLAT